MIVLVLMHSSAAIVRTATVEQLITCEDEVCKEAAVPCVLEPGGVVFFCYGVVHGTGAGCRVHYESEI